MYVFNEGVPRSGKSYDAVQTHVLPALAAGRKVFARINGLNVEAIAAYLKVSEARVRELLQQVETADVRRFFVAERDASGTWKIRDELKDALFVIDEAHEFYVASSKAIDPAIEQFFALCGQNGMDGVLMSQWYKRLHSSVRARVERKNVFQKLTALGMENRYVVKRYHATEPDHFELVDSQTYVYDPAIFPLYHGYAPGSANTAVYKAGGTTVWVRIRKYAWLLIPAVILACFVLRSFFRSDGSSFVKVNQQAPSVSPRPVVDPKPVVPQVAAALSKSTYDVKGMPPEVRYVFDLCNRARPRLAGLVKGSGFDGGMVEWQSEQGAVLDRLSFAQIRDLGVSIAEHAYGVKLSWRDQAVIVTPWPLPQSMSTGQGQSSRSSESVVRRNDVASAGQVSGDWASSSMRADYVPPELEKRPDYSPRAMR